MKSQEMKKRLKRLISCIVFLALVWTVFLRCTYLFRNIGYNTRPQILGFYLEEPDSLDVIFVGPSSVSCYWDPMLAWYEYGFTSYSYSVPSMTEDVMRYCIKDIEKTQKPVAFVVDVRSYLSRSSKGDINGAKYRNFLDSLDFGLERLEAVNYVRKLRGVSVKDAVTEFIDLIYYHNNKSILTSKSNWIMWDNRIDTSSYDQSLYKGSLLTSANIHRFFQKPQIVTDEVSPLDGGSDKALRDLLTYCQKNNIPVMLTASPFVFTEEDAKEFNMIAKIAGEYNIPFLNVNQHVDEFGLDYSMDFFDGSHINLLGMEKYTRYIADYLQEHYAIPRQHDDALTAAWDELYTSYEKEAKKIKSQILTVIADKMQAIADESAMRMTSDAGEWLSLADNSNMTVFILMDQKSDYSPTLVNERLLKHYGLTAAILEEDRFFCVYNGEVARSSVSKTSLSGRFGASGKERPTYTLRVGEQSQIMINDRNYISGNQKGLHMVVFDNNTYDFVDSVRLTISADGELHLAHDPAA